MTNFKHWWLEKIPKTHLYYIKQNRAYIKKYMLILFFTNINLTKNKDTKNTKASWSWSVICMIRTKFDDVILLYHSNAYCLIRFAWQQYMVNDEMIFEWNVLNLNITYSKKYVIFKKYVILKHLEKTNFFLSKFRLLKTQF